MRRNLIHFWRINLAVALGAAIATAVLTGALLVGDSVKGSLRDLTLERLGEIDYLLLRQEFFRESLSDSLAAQNGFKGLFKRSAPAIFTNGVAVQAKTKNRASQINVIAVDERFLQFYDDSITDSLKAGLGKKTRQLFPSIVINQSLQKQLNAKVGDQILLAVENPSEVARGSLLGEKDTEDLVETSRFILTRIIPDKGVGRFGIRSHQNLPMNAFVQLKVMQKELGRVGEINLLAIAQTAPPEIDQSEKLSNFLAPQLEMADLGLTCLDVGNAFTVESRSSILAPPVVERIMQAGEGAGLETLPAYTYLANKMTLNNRAVPYSSVSAFNTPVSENFGEFNLKNGRPAPALAANEILINEWVADDLKAKSGDSIEMTYFAVGANDQLYEKTHTFKIAGILKMAGLAIDKTLTPDFEGISGSENMADWDPPFAIDLDAIRPKDENYWDRHRGTPKAFVALAIGQKLWGSRFGKITAVRFTSENNLNAAQDRFTAALLKEQQPDEFGYVFQPIKAQGLSSSAGATDFGGLFIAFSQFLIIAAALLVGLLFRLGVEQRGKEIGLLLALGYTAPTIRAGLFAEGSLLAALGAMLGLPAAVIYTRILLSGLSSWWVTAIGTPFLTLHISPVTLCIGFFISIFVILLSIWLAFRKVSKLSPSALLAGVISTASDQKSGKRTRWIAWGSLSLALLLAIIDFIGGDAANSPESFFGVGTLLLVSGLSFFASWLRGKHKNLATKSGLAAALQMAVRNAPRNSGRSLLSAALVACACFVIVAVAANRHVLGEEIKRKDAGAGGFSLIAQADIPLLRDITSVAGRRNLGFSDKEAEELSSAEIMPFRFLPGDDASCLNLYQVEKPRILGVHKRQVERGGFAFQSLLEQNNSEIKNPWQLLNSDLEPNVIPAFGDANSVMWILHSGLGREIEMTDEFGKKIYLRFVGLMKKSIFQSELLISEENFLKHFPSRNGYAYYLINSADDKLVEHTQILESALSDYGFDITATRQRLADFQAVENTYMSTFQALGGLGLLLGVFGLGIILIRNVIERRGELATLRAFGFRSVFLGLLVLVENAFLMLLGMAVGSGAALVAVLPNLLSHAGDISWTSLILTLVIVFAVGMLSSILAVSQALRIPLLPALRAE